MQINWLVDQLLPFYRSLHCRSILKEMNFILSSLIIKNVVALVSVCVCDIIPAFSQHGKSRDAPEVASRTPFNASAPEAADLTREVPLSKHRKGFLRRRMSIASMLSWSKVDKL